MGSHTHTPPLEHQSSDGSIRKRVCKACDRCRLKKSKCDGSNPCTRCKADNAICVFGERKKSHDKVYPKGYVEMLEQQQTQLVSGLQELYKRAVNGQGWLGSPLAESNNGHPLTHDILERLGALKQEGHTGTENFEEDTNVIRQRLIASGAGFMQRAESLDGSESPRSTNFDVVAPPKPLFNDPFTLSTNFPPTPPDNNSPYPSYGSQQSPASFKMQGFAQPTPRSTALNPAILSQQNWSMGMMDIDDNMNFMNMQSPADFESLSNQFLASPVSMNTMSPSCLPVGDWNDEEAFQTFFNPTPA